MRYLLAPFCLLLLAAGTAAQQSNAPLAVSESEARQHLVQKSEAVYPPIARAARVQGDVVITVVIDGNGLVSSEKFVSGSLMLRQAALDAVKAWRFSPFQANGSATVATSTLTISFQIDKPGEGPSAEQEKAAQAWFPLSDKCREALRAQNVQGGLDSCKEALDMAIKAGEVTSSDQLGNMLSHQYYGHALLSAGKVNEALDQENLSIEEAKKCLKDDDQEYAMPFFWRGIVEARLSQTDAALADFTLAELVHRRAIKNLPDMKVRYSQALGSILKTHAALLDAVGKPEEAAKLRIAAASL